MINVQNIKIFYGKSLSIFSANVIFESMVMLGIELVTI